MSGAADPGGSDGRAEAVAVIGADVAARFRLATLPTPPIRAPRLAEVMGGGAGALYVKRDDLTGFALAGNKARPLEFLLADAIADGADTLVTGVPERASVDAGLPVAAAELAGGGRRPYLVYTAKALALVSRYAAGGDVVFWHTGGQLDVIALAEGAGR
jgi:hypothetical protein